MKTKLFAQGVTWLSVSTALGRKEERKAQTVQFNSKKVWGNSHSVRPWQLPAPLQLQVPLYWLHRHPIAWNMHQNCPLHLASNKPLPLFHLWSKTSSVATERLKMLFSAGAAGGFTSDPLLSVSFCRNTWGQLPIHLPVNFMRKSEKSDHIMVSANTSFHKLINSVCKPWELVFIAGGCWNRGFAAKLWHWCLVRTSAEVTHKLSDSGRDAQQVDSLPHFTWAAIYIKRIQSELSTCKPI